MSSGSDSERLGEREREPSKWVGPGAGQAGQCAGLAKMEATSARDAAANFKFAARGQRRVADDLNAAHPQLTLLHATR